MKVRTGFTFDDEQLRSVRAAIGRGGKATRKECLTFIDRAVRTALDAAPTPRRARVKPVTAADIVTSGEVARRAETVHARTYPGGCPQLCEACAKRLGIASETEEQRLRRVRNNIARKFGHQTIAIEVTRG